MYVVCLPHCLAQVYHTLDSGAVSQLLHLRHVPCLHLHPQVYHALDSTVVCQLLNLRYVFCLPSALPFTSIPCLGQQSCLEISQLLNLIPVPYLHHMPPDGVQCLTYLTCFQLLDLQQGSCLAKSALQSSLHHFCIGRVSLENLTGSLPSAYWMIARLQVLVTILVLYLL